MRLRVIIPLLVLLGGLTACGGDNGTTPSGSSGSTKGSSGSTGRVTTGSSSSTGRSSSSSSSGGTIEGSTSTSSSSSSTSTGSSASSTSSGSSTASSTDSGSTTASSTTASSTDSGSTTASSTDSGSTTSGSSDSGTTSAGTTDSGSTSSGSTDSGSTTSGSSTGSSGSTGAVGTSAQIAAVRAAISSGTFSGDMPIQGAIVSYIKSDLGDLTDGGAEGPGFFIQNDATGPALFFESQQISIPGDLAVGDQLDIDVLGGSVDQGITYVDQATVNRVATGATVPAPQDLSNDSRFQSKIPSDGGWDIESELVSFTGTLDGGWTGAGNGFESVTLETAGTAGKSQLKLRLPAALVDQAGLFSGCQVQLFQAPMWRFNSTPEATAWNDTDGTTLSCPPVTVDIAPSSSSAPVSSNVILTFNAPIDPTTLTAQTAPGACSGTVQVSTDGFNTCIGFAAPPYFSSGETTVATLVPTPGLSYASTYSVKVVGGANGVFALDGDALAADVTGTFTAEVPTGPTCTDLASGAVVISQIYGGSSLTSTVSNDYVELHNRSAQSIPVDNVTLQYQTKGSSTWNVIATLAGSIPAGGYYLIGEALANGATSNLPTPDATGTTNLNSTDGKLALVNSPNALTSCPAAGQVLDLVGYGAPSVACHEGSGNATSSSSAAIFRVSNECTDTNDNAADFVTGTPNPRNTSSAGFVCTCGTGSDTANGTGGEANYCAVLSNASLTASAGTSTSAIPGELYQASVTDTGGTQPAASVVAQVGFGPTSVNPEDQAGWTWTNATYTGQGGTLNHNNEFSAPLAIPANAAAGNYFYTYRFSLDNGGTWTYCDADTGNSPHFQVTKLPTLTVQ